MRARAAISVTAGPDGTSILRELRSIPPLSLRPTPGALYLVGSAAGPVGGDDVELAVDVAPGARLTVRSVAATVALPGPSHRASCFTVRARVGAGASLHWLPEPLVLAAGCNHAARAEIALDAGAELVWRDEVVLGRWQEESGAGTSALSVELDRRPLVRHQLAVGPDAPGATGPAVLDGRRVCGALLLVGVAAPRRPHPERPDPQAGVLDLDGPGVLVTALGDDHPTVRTRLDAHLGPEQAVQRSVAGPRARSAAR